MQEPIEQPPSKDEYDSPWKEILEHFFDSFMAFFFQSAHADIDWSIPHEFLDKELQRVMPQSQEGHRVVDKLVKVWLKDGTETWLLVYIEVQTSYQSDFAKRMFVYNYRLYERYNHEIVSMAVLGDENLSWRSQEF